MNRANALMMFTLGLAMVAAPHAAPGSFPSTAIDGSSTRALWMTVVGAAQCGLVALWLAREALGRAWQRIATPPDRPHPQADVEDVEATLLLAPAATATVLEPEGTITLNGEYAELWRAFQTALQSEGPAAQLAEQAVAMARGERDGNREYATTDDPVAGLRFEWAQTEASGDRGKHEQRMAA